MILGRSHFVPLTLFPRCYLCIQSSEMAYTKQLQDALASCPKGDFTLGGLWKGAPAVPGLEVEGFGTMSPPSKLRH